MKTILAVTAVFLFLGGMALANHVSTEEHVVVVDPPPITTTIQDEDTIQHETTTVVETTTTVQTVTTPPVTVTVTTSTPTTTDQEPPPGLPVRPEPNERIFATEDWNCNRQYNWPIRVDVNASNVRPNNSVNGDVQLDGGCNALNVGGQDGVCDLYLNINGNGSDVGSATDGMVLRGANNLDVCGIPGETDLECGAGQSHKDGVQQNNAVSVHFWEFQSGNWQNKVSTCHGAGGIFYVSQLNNVASGLRDVVCHYCVMVGGLPGNPGGVGLHLGASTDSGAEHGCFMGRVSNGIRSDGLAVRPINEDNVGANVDSSSASPFCPALSRL